jgi:GxxExxY protein
MTRKEEVTGLIYKEESYAIIGACFAVYKDKGCGFLEPVYHECLEIEFESQSIPFLSKPPQTVQTFSPDFICYEKIIVEIKAVSALVDEHHAQVLNYLSAMGCELALLVNFGHYPRLEYERLLPRKPEPVDFRL